MNGIKGTAEKSDLFQSILTDDPWIVDFRLLIVGMKRKSRLIGDDWVVQSTIVNHQSISGLSGLGSCLPVSEYDELGGC